MWVEQYFNPHSENCSNCIQTQFFVNAKAKKNVLPICFGIETVEVCPRGLIQKASSILSSENLWFWNLWNQITYGGLKEFGFDYQAIDLVCEYLQISKGVRWLILEKVICCYSTYLKYKNQKITEQ